MKIILIKNINGLGKIGDIKEVKDGYARNFLLPQNLAKQMTEKVVKEIEAVKQRQEKNKIKQSKKYQELARKLNNLKLIIKVKADESKKLFGSVNGVKISEELKKRNYEVDPKFVKIGEPIKILGYHEVHLDFGGGVGAKLGLTVAREE